MSVSVNVSWIPIDTGCLLDGVNGAPRSFSQLLGTNQTPASCQALAQANNLTLCGLEYGGECWADSAYQNKTGAIDAPASDCNMPCNANSSFICGAGNRLSAYSYGTVLAPPPPPPPPPTTTSSTSASSSPSPTPTSIPAGWSYVGCVSEGNGFRALTYGQGNLAPMTNPVCINACIKAGYPIAGTEYGGECYCGFDVRGGGQTQPDDSSCSSVCAGNGAEKCGGPNRLTVYSTLSNITYWPAPTTTKTNLPSSYQYYGCVKDNVNNVRTLFWRMEYNNMTVSMCLNHCATYGYTYAGVEYGTQCFCDDLPADPTSLLVPETQCNAPCGGRPSEYCGSGGLLTMYKLTSPLTVFNQPANPGRYEYWMGGLIVPLVSGLTIQNKVVFMEKLTGGAPNSTHTYEMGYASQDYTQVFRAMHVQTDFFCSAGLMLPDKVGRIINIGGWADTALLGVRFYSPALANATVQNDWEENVDQIHLQVTRWYPTAVILNNGSIAVFGGEDHSNGDNQPSVEVLPYTGAAPISMPILVETHPNNLYPHALVLPSGNLFLSADNRAQIIDPNTFAAIKELPLVPASAYSVGAVSNGYSGGRTYPASGSASIIPMRPPYTSPMEVIICGGSSRGDLGMAIDNCARGAPEAPSMNWVVERMPFARVMPNMVALPDGTFLICNGAFNGVGGFGLASNPVLTGVLYNPDGPVGNRFSILNSTIVARMYHSEALLLHDGRVLISGSDPQQAPTYPEEYRIEVYLPPYLTSGLPRPTFTALSTTNWGYGVTVSLRATLPSGGPIRAILVAPGVNTHGNSMGQRSIWLSITLNAGTTNTYTVTTPPNNKILPDNHYLLFVLDGPTPSVGQWVRVGGDPGNIGNWPQGVAGITPPGI